MLVEKRLPLALSGAAAASRRSCSPAIPNFKDPRADVTAFMYDRLRGLLRERGFTPNEVEAVVAQQPDRWTTSSQRLEAVQAFAALPEAESLAAANKRITNILKKAERGGARRCSAACCRKTPNKACTRR